MPEHQPEVKAAHEDTLTSFHYITSLPQEIRTMIYEYALCPGIVYVHAKDMCGGDYTNPCEHRFSTYRDTDRDGDLMPGPAHDHKDNRRLRYADWELIKKETSPINQSLMRGVSKAVQEEASAAFYGPKNHFVLPCGPYDSPKTSGHLYMYCEELPDIPPFRSVSYTFDMRDLHWDPWTAREDVKDTDSDELEEFARSHNVHEVQFDMQVRVHSMVLTDLEALWDKRCEIIRRKLRANFLQIDFEECYCPLGCCRFVENVCMMMGPFDNEFPETFEAVGVKDEAEALLIRDIVTGVNWIEERRVVCKDVRGNVLSV